MNKRVLLSLIIVSNGLNCMDSNAPIINNIKYISSTKDIDLFYDDYGFHIKNKNDVFDIPPHFVEPELRNIPVEYLRLYLKHGYIVLNKIGENEYILRANVKGIGGNWAECIWFGVKWLIKEVAKKAIVDGAYNTACKYWKSYTHPDPEQIAKVKSTHRNNAIKRVSEIYDEILTPEALSMEVGHQMVWSDEYERWLLYWPYTAYKLQDVITAKGFTIKESIVMRIVDQGFLSALEADAVYEYMKKTVYLG